MKRILTISATYGAGGSVIAPALARRLELPFLDRAVHADDVAIEARAQGEGLADDERDQSLVQRILHAFTTVPDDASAWVPPALPDRVATLRSEAEATVRSFLKASGGVVLGWGA